MLNRLVTKEVEVYADEGTATISGAGEMLSFDGKAVVEA